MPKPVGALNSYIFAYIVHLVGLVMGNSNIMHGVNNITTHIHSPVGIRTHDPSNRGLQTYDLDRAATGIGRKGVCLYTCVCVCVLKSLCSMHTVIFFRCLKLKRSCSYFMRTLPNATSYSLRMNTFTCLTVKASSTTTQLTVDDPISKPFHIILPK